MTSDALIPISTDKNSSSQSSSNHYAIHDHGNGFRTYSYEFHLNDYEPEEIAVLLDNNGRLRIRAYRSPCHEFRREYDLGGPNVEAKLVRNTIDIYGHLRVDVDVRPRQLDSSPVNANTLTFDLHGYRPKNINVRIDESGLLKISAQHNDDTSEHRVSREYYRQYQLPKYINPNEVHAKLDEHQILTIHLPQSSSKQNLSWQPYYGAHDSSAYRKRPYGKSCCCCNVM